VINTASSIRRITEDAVKHGAPAPASRAVAGELASAGSSAKRLDKRLLWVGTGVLGAVLVALLIAHFAGGSGGDRTAASGQPAGAPAATAASPGSTAAPSTAAQLEQARQLVARGEWEGAVAVLNRVRADDPDGADAPYLLATIYLDNKRWSDGLAAAQVAVHKNPALKSDPDLIKAALHSLVSDHSYEKSQAFLRSLGAPATPFIKEAARHDESAKVRERAAEILQGGSQGAFGRGSWGSSSHASGGSMFKR
jgi:hypothetical protein